MNRSLVIITIAAALGLAACTSTPAPKPDDNATPTPQATVVTEVVTHTVTNPPPPPPAKPVIDSFGYGSLKLGMTLQQALDTKLVGPNIYGSPGCTLHEILGTDRRIWISPDIGVSTISFNADMTADGAGIGASEAKVKTEYTNLEPSGPTYPARADADGNPKARFVFRFSEGRVYESYLELKDQRCHN